MTNKLLILVIMLAFTSCSKENEQNDTASGKEEISFSFETGIYAKTSLPYRKAVIATDNNKQSALVLYLHGGSSKGNDNTAPINEKGVGAIENYLVSQHINSIFLVPQCPSDKSWGGIMNTVLKELINDYIAREAVDAKRIYILGGSMGGTGTWGMVSCYPDLFAAAMPVAGDPSKCEITNIVRTPILTVMGTDDKIMNIAVVEDFINRLTLLGNENIFEIEDGWSHENTCMESYTVDRLQWVFNHSK